MSPDSLPQQPIDWKFTPGPASLTKDKFWERYSHPDMPEKFEASHHQLFWTDQQRYHVLAMLAEGLGTAAVSAFFTRPWFQLALEVPPIREVPITASIAIRAAELPRIHTDPAERFIISS